MKITDINAQTGTVDDSEIKHDDDGASRGFFDDGKDGASHENAELESQADEVVDDATDENAADADADDSGEPDGDDNDASVDSDEAGDEANEVSEDHQSLREAIAKDNGFDLSNPKHLAIIDKAIADAEEDEAEDEDSSNKSSETAFERRLREREEAAAKAAEDAKNKPKEDKEGKSAEGSGSKSTVAQRLQRGYEAGVNFDFEKHIHNELELMHEAFGEGDISPEKRKRAISQLREIRADEQAANFLANLCSSDVVRLLNDIIDERVGPDLKHVRAITGTWQEGSARQRAFKSAIVELSAKDPSYTEFTTSNGGQPSAYETVLTKKPWIAGIQLPDKYKNLPTDDQRVMLELIKLREAKEVYGVLFPKGKASASGTSGTAKSTLVKGKDGSGKPATNTKSNTSGGKVTSGKLAVSPDKVRDKAKLIAKGAKAALSADAVKRAKAALSKGGGQGATGRGTGKGGDGSYLSILQQTAARGRGPLNMG